MITHFWCVLSGARIHHGDMPSSFLEYRFVPGICRFLSVCVCVSVNLSPLSSSMAESSLVALRATHYHGAHHSVPHLLYCFHRGELVNSRGTLL